MFWKLRFRFHYYVIQICFKLKDFTLKRKKFKAYKLLDEWQSYHLSKFFKLSETGEKKIGSE